MRRAAVSLAWPRPSRAKVRDTVLPQTLNPAAFLITDFCSDLIMR